jgi:hypothetical protein
MPVHDWTRVSAGTFHAFHGAWITHLSESLNGGLLPPEYYALPEQHAGLAIADVLTLRLPGSSVSPAPTAATGGLAVAEAPPKVSRRLSVDPARRPRTLAIRHASGHHVVALVEIVSPSPANLDRPASVRAFARKAATALECGCHLLILDLFPPGPHAPWGLPQAVWRRFTRRGYSLPDGRPLTLAAFATGPRPEAYLEHLAVGTALRDMPLFLSAERYVNAPLEPTYRAAYRGMPAVWRNVLEGPPATA